LPVTGVFTVDCGSGTSFDYDAVSNDAIGRALFWRGLMGVEPETVKVFRAVAARSRLIYDVGANTGLYTLLACATSPDARVVSCEPVPRVFSRLRVNLETNQFTQRCTALELAVGSSRCSSRLHVPYADVPTSSSLSESGFRGLDGELIPVEVETLDQLATEHGVPDLMKIDVEGHEHSVLAGATEILRTRPAIILECNPDGPYESVDGILSEHRYVFHRIGRSGLETSRRIRPDCREMCRNYLCLPPGQDLR
jgi:FkbM family methyltransferase